MLHDGEFHSGPLLGRELGISRAAVGQHIDRLRDAGLPVFAVPGRGYRLAPGIRLLDPELIREMLTPAARGLVREVEVVTSVQSTNSAMQERVAGEAHARALLAESQPAGRGRRGRSWIVSPFRNLVMTLGWSYGEWPSAVTALGLVTAAVVARVLSQQKVPDIEIKWPNDLMWRSRKLGGILVDIVGESSGPCHVAVGVGINVEIIEADAKRIDQPWVDLAGITGLTPDRNALAAAILSNLAVALADYPAHGFAPYRGEWEARHALRGRDVVVDSDAGRFSGRIDGIDDSGALLLRTHGQTRRFFHGEVTIQQWR